MEPTSSSKGPLAGITVIELATIFAAPSACRRLADFGADVIKVERPGESDGARRLGETDGDDSFYWRLVGRNKRPIELDLKHPDGRAALLQLVERADVVVENFRPGTLERLGLDPVEVLLRAKPSLVVLRVTGYGQDGPYAGRAGFGTIAEGMSTLAHCTGQPDGPPTLPPIALADEVTGLQGAFAVMVALHHAQRTGEGQVIDASLLESLLDIVGPGPAIYERTGHVDGRYGSRLVFSAPRNVYRCADGWAVLSGSANEAALRIFDAIGHPELRTDPRFCTGPARLAHVDELDRLIEEWTSRRPVSDVVETLSAAGAACGPVYDVAQLLADEHVRERRSFVEVVSPDGEAPVLQPAPTPRLSRTPGAVRHAGLAPGACTREVLEELGYAPHDIDRLVSNRVAGELTPAQAAA
ncbi:MAG: CaiB/BaiF CoA-transferase family protein [Gaiellales bacterium]